MEFFTAETTINPPVFARRLTDGGKVESPSAVRNCTCERSLMMHRRALLLARIDHVKVRRRFHTSVPSHAAAEMKPATGFVFFFRFFFPAAIDLMLGAPETVSVEASGGKKYTHQQVPC